MTESPSAPTPDPTEPSAPPTPPASDELPGKARAVELLAQEIVTADFVSPDTAPVTLTDLSTVHVPASPSDLRSNERLLTDMLGREYDNFNQSGFHSDNLRNQIIQFYLILVGAAATAIVGIAQLQSGGTSAAPLTNQALWPFSAIAFFIGLIGIIMLPIFVRLRRVVLECLAGTVLIKRFVERSLGRTADTLFGSAMLWDARSLPLDENYLTASFVLVFVVMLLSSVMVALGVFLHLYEGLLAEKSDVYGAFAWSLFVGSAVLTLQVIAYRLWLAYEINKFIKNDQLREKWAALEIKSVPVRSPAIVRPILEALVFFGLPTLYFFYSASIWLSFSEMWRLVTIGL